MKKFTFPLERVLQWRETQVTIEEAKLEQLNVELRKIDTFEAHIRTEHAAEETAVLGARSATGADLAALEHYRKANVKQIEHLHRLRAECTRRIAAQMQEVARRRLDARLLEKLKHKRIAEWRAGFHRELEEQASEAYLAKWNSAQ